MTDERRTCNITTIKSRGKEPSGFAIRHITHLAIVCPTRAIAVANIGIPPNYTTPWHSYTSDATAYG